MEAVRVTSAGGHHAYCIMRIPAFRGAYSDLAFNAPSPVCFVAPPRRWPAYPSSSLRASRAAALGVNVTAIVFTSIKMCACKAGGGDGPGCRGCRIPADARGHCGREPSHEKSHHLPVVDLGRSFRSAAPCGARRGEAAGSALFGHFLRLPAPLDRPALLSGRISCIAVHPEERQTWYIGVASGGVWKTTNAGITWPRSSRTRVPTP